MSAIAAEILPHQTPILDTVSVTPSPLLEFPTSPDIRPTSWDASQFHSHITSAINKEPGAVPAFAEYATREIQSGNLVHLIKSITATYEGNDAIQTYARRTVMDTYLAVIDANGMGVSTYDAVTKSMPTTPTSRPKFGISTKDYIDPQYSPRTE